MPRKPEDTADVKPQAPRAEEPLVPFSVIIDGDDRVVFAKDEEDLKARVARIRGQ